MSSATQKVKLQASDGEEFEIGTLYRYVFPNPFDCANVQADRQVAERSILIKNLLDDIPDATVGGEAIPIMNVSHPTGPASLHGR